MMLRWDDSDTESASDNGTICVTDSPSPVVGEVLETASPAAELESHLDSALNDDIAPLEADGPPLLLAVDGLGTVLSMELHNFKSYRGTVRIGDFKKFTAIIGPNGCGKSNLMDAISFVLCVSSTILRGMNLKDFIYKARSGDEVPSEAYVSLTLKGTHREVTFKRHISAAGAVSYLVDGSLISFKQYKELLREYRINTLGSTGLIFQGAVNDIASRSPIELTRLFETISGSSIYAKPYNYIKEKLERRRMEHRDLVCRRKALQQELRQYRSMTSKSVNYDDVLAQYKAAEAQKYACDFRLLQLKFNEQHQSYQHVLQRRDELNDRWSTMQAKRDELECKRSTLYFEQGQLYRAIQGKNKQLLSKKESMHEYYESKSALEQRISGLDTLRQSLEGDIDRLRLELETLVSQEYNLQEAVSACVAEIESLKCTTISLSPGQRRQYDDLLQSFNKATSAVRIKMNLLTSNIDSSSSERDQLQSELDSLRRYHEKLVASSKPHAAMHESLCTRLRETNDSIELLSMTKSRLEHEKSQVTTRRSSLEDEKNMLDEQLKTLNVAKVEYRQILRRRQYTQDLMAAIPGVHGEVLSLCEITNFCYHDAIMAALNTRGHMIVTDNLSTIQACITRLQKDKVFKRDFLPLDSLRHGKSLNRVGIAEFVRSRGLKVQYTLAIDCLIFEHKYSGLFEHLLGDTIIVPSLDDAERLISYDRGSLLSFNVVTQKGQVITRDRTIIIDSAIYTKNSQIELEIAEFSRLTLKSERLEQDIHLLTRKLTTIESSLQDTTNRIQKHRRAVDLLQMKVDFSLKHTEASASQLRMSEEKISSATTRLSEVESELKAQRIEHAKEQLVLQRMQQSHFEKLNEELGVEDVYAILTSSSDTVLRVQAQLERKRAFLSRCVNDKHELENTIGRLTEISLPEVVDKHQDALAKLHELLKGNQVLYRELTSLEKEIASDQEHLDDISRQIEKCHEHIKLVQYEYDYGCEQDTNPSEDSFEDVHTAGSTRSALDTNNGVERTELSSRVVPLRERKEAISSKLVELVSSMRELQHSAVALSEECRLRNVNCEIVVPEALIGTSETNFIAEFPNITSNNLLEGVSNDVSEIERSISKLNGEMQSLRKLLSTSRVSDDAEMRMQRAQVDSDHLDRELATAKAECASLEADFDRIKKERTGLFMNCFQSVKRLVGPIYRSLSAQDNTDEMSGGSAFLSLDDDLSGSVTEPFLCSIRYNTMPPMKKFLDISLQSGGEKALSSLALLLALHSFRKSPFVVLDEIDANLDNVKVQSLAAFLQRSPFQVIIISLKAKLFSRADVLVGVYSKQPTASSSCVVLNMSDYENDDDRSSSPLAIEQYT
ncbi:putative structural maintenance of chromosome 1-like protein [Babesia divergens]|uniref:Structural maintenance of chromosomes protein n=1 Tax=Babesia divergens TaxID=32595 RepID=A0AAD9GA46_BABDI|nr:putative structural maintenance of chromosome 1-like protein [Babesia divergens]